MVFGLARFDVDLGQRLLDDFDDLGDILLVRVIVCGIFDNVLEEKRVSGQSGGWLGQVSVEFELPRLLHPLDLVDEFAEEVVGALFVLKLVLTEELVGAVLDEWAKVRDVFEENVQMLAVRRGI